MLYAILVEGVGPLGSVFSRDDFTDKEVKDTDGDGLPEFVDAWGQPLQFFRWPLLYHSDIQRGQAIDLGPDARQSWTLLRPLRQRARPARAGPARPQPAAHGAGVVADDQHRRARGQSRLAVHRGSGAAVPPGASVSPAAQSFEHFFHRL